MEWKHSLTLIQQAAKDSVITKAKIVIPEKWKVCKRVGSKSNQNINVAKYWTESIPLVLPT